MPAYFFGSDRHESRDAEIRQRWGNVESFEKSVVAENAQGFACKCECEWGDIDDHFQDLKRQLAEVAGEHVA